MRPLGEMPETRSEAVEAQYDSGHLKVPESKEAVVDVGAVSKWYKKLKNGTKKIIAIDQSTLKIEKSFSP